MNKKRNRSIELDLTSFIDVIFVILIAFMFIYTNKNSSLQPTPAPVVNPMDDVVSIGLLVEYSDENVETRNIQLSCNPEMNLELIAPAEGDNDESFVALEEQITQIVNDNPDVPVLLSMYEDKILYKDHKRIEEIVGQLAEKDNFYPTWKRNVVEETVSESTAEDIAENSNGQ